MEIPETPSVESQQHIPMLLTLENKQGQLWLHIDSAFFLLQQNWPKIDGFTIYLFFLSNKMHFKWENGIWQTISCILNAIKCNLTKKSAQEEDTQRHINDRWGDVDEPVRKEGSYSQKNDVINEVLSVLVHLQWQ